MKDLWKRELGDAFLDSLLITVFITAALFSLYLVLKLLFFSNLVLGLLFVGAVACGTYFNYHCRLETVWTGKNEAHFRFRRTADKDGDG